MKNLLFVVLLSLFLACQPNYYKKYANTKAAWEKEVNALVELDKTEKDPQDAILFIGSSSIRLWKNIEKDLAPFRPIKRGYGGASLSDMIHFTKKIVFPHKFKALVIYVGNDITGSKNDKTPEEVLGLTKTLVKKVRSKYPKTPIFIIGITPTSSRWLAWKKQKEVNTLWMNYCESKSNMYFIDTEKAYLDIEGNPKDELFIGDKLHQNQNGYDLWSLIIKESLIKNLK